MTKRRSIGKKKWALGVALGAVLVVAGASTAYAAHFSDVALPGVNIAGTSVTGMTEPEVQALVSQMAADVTVTATVDGQAETATLEELGVTVDPLATASDAFRRNSSVFSRFGALFSRDQVPVVYTVDEPTLGRFASQVVSLAAEPVQEGAVEISDTGDYFVAVEAAAGAAVDTELLEDSVTEAASTLESQEVTLEIEIVEPIISTAQAEQAAGAANELIGIDVTLYGTVSVNPASKTEIMEWVEFPQSADGLGAPEFDVQKVTAWVKATADNTEDLAVPGIQNVDSSGKVVATASPGTPGMSASNVEEITAELLAAITAGQSYSGTFTYEEVEPGFEQLPALPGTENLAYRPHEGEKWIDINLSNFSVTAYVGSEVVHGPVLMVHGMDEAPTVTGTYNIYLKYEMQTMRGTNPDGTKYVSPDVPWVSYFYEGYALHGAPWRSTFGYAGSEGSHGCVNLPVSDAKWFYDFGDIGTIVVSHN